jgi:hypothetical protein
MQQTIPSDPPRFAASICYQHGGEDERLAVRLQRGLERYRIPAHLAPDTSAHRSRQFTISRDKTDLDSHAILETGLRSRVESSRFLIVICSPRSASSPYVADEVRWFVENGRENDIIPLIIEGAPVPADKTEEERYPPTLPLRILGIDAREGGEDETLIKVVARLQRVEYAFLYQRHLRARRRSMIKALALAASVLAVVGGLAFWVLSAERQAVAERNQAEVLVEFLARDLSEDAFTYIPQRTRKKITDRLDDYYHQRREGEISDAALLYQARLLEFQADDARAAGKSAVSLELLLRARERIEKLLAGSPDNGRILGLAHSNQLALFMTERELGHVPEAEAALNQVLLLARRYADLPASEGAREDPQAQGVRLALMARSSEAAALFAWEQGDRQESLRHSRDALAAWEEQSASDPADTTASVAYSRALRALCSRLETADVLEAEQFCLRSLEVAEIAAKADPFNQDAQEQLLQALDSMAGLRLEQLRLAEAEAYSARALEKAQLLAAHDPENILRQGHLGAEMTFRAAVLHLAGRISGEEAAAMTNEGGILVAGAGARVRGTALEESARRALARFQDRQALLTTTGADEGVTQAVVARAREQVDKNPDDARALYALADALSAAFLQSQWKTTPQQALLLGREARQAHEQYRRRMPSDSEAAVEYCELLAAMGVVARAAGETALAASLYADGIEAAEKLLETEPKNSEARMALAEAAGGMGEALVSDGRCEQAHQYFLRALAAMRPAYAADPAYWLTAARLNLALQSAGWSHFRRGESEKGLALLREALQIASAAKAAINDLSPVMATGYNESAALLGLCLASLGQTSEGAELAAAALEQARQGAQSDAERWQAYLLLRLQQNAHIQLLQGDAAKALPFATEALPLALRNLDSADPTDMISLAVADEYAAALIALGRHMEALPLLETALTAAAKASPHDAATRQITASLLSHKAEALTEGPGSPDSAGADALAACDKALALLATLTEASPEEAEWTLLRSRLLAARGDALLAARDAAAALGLYAQSLETLRHLLAAEPRRLEARSCLLRVLKSAAAAHDAAGQTEQGKVMRQEAEQIRLKGEELAPGLSLWKQPL